MKRTLTVVSVTLLSLAGLIHGQQLSNPMVPLFTPVDITADINGLPKSERAALAKILKAAQIMDGLFLEQVWTGNPSLLLQLQNNQSQTDRDVLDFFLINKGPWSRLEENRPFVAGVPEKPRGAGYYPTDSTREEITTWIDGLSDNDRREATGFFTTIRRDANGSLQTVPYNLEYQGPLELAATHLRKAAALTAEPTLKQYLESRATAFLSNEYYDSDIAWMEIDSRIEPTIGPYEVYEDEWFNYKAAFEAFVTIRDDTETAQLSRFANELQELEDNLPIHPDYRDPQLGALAPIRVVNVVFTAGDANSGVQTAAFNLPNDERVIRDKGSKRVMLKNVQQAKFDHILTPITMVALSPQERPDVSFDGFFTHILMHELMHGLGPHSIRVNDQPTTVRQTLQETYSAIEEAKADISGLWGLQRLIDKGVVDSSLERSIYTTFLASTFRSIRFGINEAHGRGVAIQLNTFLDSGAVTVRPDGTFSVDHSRIRASVEDLTRRIMTIQAEGNYAAAKEMLATLGVVRPEVQNVIDRLANIPIDIRPNYTTADQLIEDSP
ncbi:MAG: hypothetical protein VX262_10300 [Acidobacteriota bacterium]|nr:hypothetical protein [Acidobacteriota bacterium]